MISKNFNNYFRSNQKKFHFNFSTLIIPEINNGKLNRNYFNLLTAANELKSQNKVFLYADKVTDNLVNSLEDTVDTVYYSEDETLKNPTSEVLSKLILNLYSKEKFTSIIAPSNMFGRNLIPRVAGLMNIEPLSDVCKILENKQFKRYIYAGNALSTIENTQSINLMTIRLTSFEQTLSSAKKQVTKSKVEFIKTNTSTFVENIETVSDKPDLSTAKVVISGGRALKSKENFKLLDDLASCFKGAAIGASRAAVDAGYVNNDLQVGQTGKTVAPNLYIAIGISGAIQHVAGIKDSKYIVAINSDPESPIFSVRNFFIFRWLITD